MDVTWQPRRVDWNVHDWNDNLTVGAVDTIVYHVAVAFKMTELVEQ